MTPRGGAREGAGAPKKDPDKKRISVTVVLDPEIVEWLDGLDGKSRSRKIEEILQKAKTEDHFEEELNKLMNEATLDQALRPAPNP